MYGHRRTGKLPAVQFRRTVVNDSYFILKFLKAECGDVLDVDLTVAEHAFGQAVTRQVEEWLVRRARIEPAPHVSPRGCICWYAAIGYVIACVYDCMLPSLVTAVLWLHDLPTLRHRDRGRDILRSMCAAC